MSDAMDYLKGLFEAIDSLGETPPITHLQARRTASEWHSGQWTPLYALASSGAIIEGCIDEILDAQVEARHIEAWGDLRRLEDLQAYIEHYDLTRGPVEGWGSLTW